MKYLKESGEIDLGYRFLPPAWSKGYGTESARHTLEYGLNDLKLKAVTARAHIENLASLKVLEKVGMKWLKDEISEGCPVKTFIAVGE